MMVSEVCSDCGDFCGPETILKYTTKEFDQIFTFRCKCTN